MSVLIKDMKMPKSCNSCDLLQDYDGDMYCPLNSYLYFGDIENVPDYVMIGCHLSEMPERKKGKWERHYSRPNVYADLYWHCSECGYKNDDQYANIYHNFCPACGSDMRGNPDD